MLPENSQQIPSLTGTELRALIRRAGVLAGQVKDQLLERGPHGWEISGRVWESLGEAGKCSRKTPRKFPANSQQTPSLTGAELRASGVPTVTIPWVSPTAINVQPLKRLGAA